MPTGRPSYIPGDNPDYDTLLTKTIEQNTKIVKGWIYTTNNEDHIIELEPVSSSTDPINLRGRIFQAVSDVSTSGTKSGKFLPRGSHMVMRAGEFVADGHLVTLELDKTPDENGKFHAIGNSVVPLNGKDEICLLGVIDRVCTSLIDVGSERKADPGDIVIVRT